MSPEITQSKHKGKNSEGKKIVIFVGPEGSGKSTLGKLLSKYLQMPYVGTGDIIRDRAKNDPGPLGQACRKMIEEHAYLDPKLIRQILSERLSQDDSSKGAVIDGGLRTLDETEHFDEILENAGKGNFEVDVIFLDIPDELGIERRLKSPELRPGENRESVLKRLEHFYTNYEERMNIIKKNYNFYKIDATKQIDGVFEEVLSVI